MKGPGCRDCVVSVVLGMPPEQSSLRIDDDELAALDVLAQSGLVPPLRLVHAVDAAELEPTHRQRPEPSADTA
ncbi:hypothetical protein [Kribbella sp. NPDC023855]|uniref:hypothetical protein n=1 Tax=Kribbella sp. NPDC023855 TaxID=3154698 RepID=UPI0033C86C6D